MSAVQLIVGGHLYALPTRGELRWDHSIPVAWLRKGDSYLVLTPEGGVPLVEDAGVLFAESWQLL
jgi:hypothetical protein